MGKSYIFILTPETTTYKKIPDYKQTLDIH